MAVSLYLQAPSPLHKTPLDSSYSIRNNCLIGSLPALWLQTPLSTESADTLFFDKRQTRLCQEKRDTDMFMNTMIGVSDGIIDCRAVVDTFLPEEPSQPETEEDEGKPWPSIYIYKLPPVFTDTSTFGLSLLYMADVFLPGDTP